MDTQQPAGSSGLTPNHHAHHPGFRGLGGLLTALSFTVGRDHDAELAVRLTALGASDYVIDVGCGAGVAARRAARSGASVVGIDPAAVMLRVARPLTRDRARVRYLEGTAEALPLPDASATVLWSIATVHHWHDLDRGLDEARRVLTPGGRLLAIERRVEAGATGHASHGWTRSQADAFAQRCRDAGFVDVEVGDHRGDRRHVLSVLAGTESTPGP